MNLFKCLTNSLCFTIWSPSAVNIGLLPIIYRNVYIDYNNTIDLPNSLNQDDFLGLIRSQSPPYRFHSVDIFKISVKLIARRSGLGFEPKVGILICNIWVFWLLCCVELQKLWIVVRLLVLFWCIKKTFRNIWNYSTRCRQMSILSQTSSLYNPKVFFLGITNRRHYFFYLV